MTDYTDALCGSVTKKKKGGDHKTMRTMIEDHTAKNAYESTKRK